MTKTVVLSSRSKSFCRNPEKISGLLMFSFWWNSLSFASVYELNLNWHIENLFCTCTWFSSRAQTFNSNNQDVLVKLRRIDFLVVVVVVILFRSHASDKFQEAISWSRTWRVFLHCFSLKYVVSGHFWWGNAPVNQNKLRMCPHFNQIRTWHRCLKLSFFGLYIYVRLSNNWNHFYETTDHLQQFRTDKFSTFFKSEAFTFSSAIAS